MTQPAVASERLSVLVVEDNPADADLVREMLRDANLVATGAVRPEVHHVDTLRGALAAAHQPFDVALLDLGLPDASGLDGLAALSAAVPELPAVIFTVARDPALAARALGAGAQDFLVKSELQGDLLLRSLRFAVARHRRAGRGPLEADEPNQARPSLDARMPSRPASARRVLLVEDSPGDADLVRSALSEGSDSFVVHHVERLRDALAYLTSADVDAVLLDLGLPDATGMECVERIRSAFPDLPVVVLTGNSSAGLEAVRTGVQDYAVKGGIAAQDLQRAIDYSIERNAHARRARELAAERAAHAATQDAARTLRRANEHLAAATRRAHEALEREAAARAHAENRHQALLESERRYRALFENMSEGFALDEILWDAQGNACDIRHLEVNPAFEQHTGLRAEEVLGRTVRELFPDVEPEWIERLGHVARTGERVHLEAKFKPLGRWFEVSAHRTEAGKVAVVFSDVTRRKHAEEAVRESDRNKGEFLTVLSHELRNPLAPILNSLYVLDHAERSSADAERAKQVIARQVRTMARLVDDLLDVTRISRGKVELRRAPVDLSALVAHIGEDHRGVAQQHGYELAVETPARAVWVDADATRLTQMIGNLLHNAGKFTGAGGRVTLALRSEHGNATVAVRDTGVGIAPDSLEHLFEPFYQAHGTLARSNGGLGLGLALVKGLAELHGGSVRALSRGPGRGAEFLVTLPLQAPSSPQP